MVGRAVNFMILNECKVVYNFRIEFSYIGTFTSLLPESPDELKKIKIINNNFFI